MELPLSASTACPSLSWLLEGAQPSVPCPSSTFAWRWLGQGSCCPPHALTAAQSLIKTPSLWLYRSLHLASKSAPVLSVGFMPLASFLKHQVPSSPLRLPPGVIPPHVQCGQLMLKLCQPHLKASPSPLLPCLQPSHWTPHPAGLSWASQASSGSLPGPPLPGMHTGAPRLRVGLALCPELPGQVNRRETGVETCQPGLQPCVFVFTTDSSSFWSVLLPSCSLCGRPQGSKSAPS